MTRHNPVTEEIRLNISGSPDWTVFPFTLLSDGDSRLLPWKIFWDSRENLFESYMGTPVKTCWNFGSSNYLKSDLLRLWMINFESYRCDNSFESRRCVNDP